ncbi:MAG TPA: AsmA-like C-terminal region-containing protein [Planctomycetota bacterium]
MLVAFFGLLLAAPHAVAIDAVREEIETELRAELGIPCRIGQLGFSWFTGLAVQGFEIGNPPEFSQARPFLRCKRAALDVSLLPLLDGRFALDGLVDGLEIHVERLADGTTNLESLFGVQAGSDGWPGVPPTVGGRDLNGVSVHLQVRESALQLRHEGELVEALSGVTCSVNKAFDSQRVAVEVETRLVPIASSDRLGKLGLRAEADVLTGIFDARLSAADLDLQRYGPLLGALCPGQADVLAGIASGVLTVRRRSNEQFTIDGDLSVLGPRLCGDLVAGMDLQSRRWRLAPVLQLRRAGGALHVADAERLAIDLGWLRVSGLPKATTLPMRSDNGPVRFAYELDVDALAALGGPVPDWLDADGGKVRGEVGVPRAFGTSTLDGLLSQCTATMHATANSIAVAGFELTAFEGTGSLRDRQFRFDTKNGTLLDRGAVALGLQVDLRGERLPSVFTLRWNGGQLRPAGVEVMRYLVPMFAGLDTDVATLSGQCDLDLALRGPACARADQNWLELLDEWAGNGSVTVRNGTVSPASELSGLLSPLGSLAPADVQLGDAATLSIDRFEAPFRFERGAISTRAAKWQRKGKEIGIAGRTRLDGQLDLAFDLSALLRGHRDGERVLSAAGGSLPVARLMGTVQSPSLALPSATALLQEVLQTGPKQAGSDTLQRELDKMLEIFKRIELPARKQ